MVAAIELSGLRQGKRSRSADIPPAVTPARLRGLHDQSMAPDVEGTGKINPPAASGAAAMPRAELAETEAAEAVASFASGGWDGADHPGVDHPVAFMVGG